MTTRSPSSSVSTTTMQVRRVTELAGNPNLTARSMTGTTLPRRFMTPRTHGGVAGTRVTASNSMISLTLRIPIANSFPARKKPRYWVVAACSGTRSMCVLLSVTTCAPAP